MTERMHPMIYLLISNKYATLKEIKEYYTLDDILDLYEACLVNIYNKNSAIINHNTNKGV